MDSKNLVKEALELIKIGNFDKALEKLNKAEEKDSYIYFLKGSVYIYLKKIDLAEENLKLAAELNNKNHSIFHNLAVLYNSKGDNELAKSNYLKALEVNNQNIPSMCELGALYVKEKNYDEAQKYFELALKKDPDHKKANLGLGNLYMKKNDYRNGYNYINKATGLIRFTEEGVKIF